ncbi:MAG: hypothetical protein JWP89_1858 [Schlesneria sp.]|nr:hypothetical protein [Schlesneria sp.]
MLNLTVVPERAAKTERLRGVAFEFRLESKQQEFVSDAAS